MGYNGHNQGYNAVSLILIATCQKLNLHLKRPYIRLWTLQAGSTVFAKTHYRDRRQDVAQEMEGK